MNGYGKKEKKEKTKDKEHKNKEPSKETRIIDNHYFRCLGKGYNVYQCPNKKVMVLKGQDIYTSHNDTPFTL